MESHIIASKTSSFQYFVRFVKTFAKLIIFVTVLLILLIPVIYHFGSDSPHQKDPHPLYSLFEKAQQYQNLTKELNKKDNKKVIITGDFNRGFREYLDHFANIQTESGNQIILNDIQEQQIPIGPYLKQAKYYIEQQLDMEENKHSTWIVTQKNAFPSQQISVLIARHPKDRFIVAISEQVPLQKIKAFKEVKFPPLSEEKFKSQIIQEIKIPSQDLEAYFKYFGGMRGIFAIIDQNQNGLTKQNILGSNFRSSSILTAEDRKIVQSLCNKGPHKTQNISNTLKGFGTIFYKTTVYWENKEALLNYELEAGKLCKADAVVPKDILQEIKAEQKEEREEREEKKKSSDKKVKQDKKKKNK